MYMFFFVVFCIVPKSAEALKQKRIAKGKRFKNKQAKRPGHSLAE